MIFLLPAFYILLFIWIIYKLEYFRISGLSFKEITSFFLLKILAGLALTFVYTYHYKDRNTADIYKYFDDAKVISNCCKNEPSKYFQILTGIKYNDEDLKSCLSQTKNWHEKTAGWLEYTGTREFNFFNSNRFVTRFNLIVMWFSFGNFYVHIVFMCFFSLLGLIGIFRVISRSMPGKERILSYVLFLLPSVLFWGSGVLKEPLLIGLTGIFLFLFLYPANPQKNGLLYTSLRLSLAALMLFFILICKYYVLAALFPGIIVKLWADLSAKMNKKSVYPQKPTGILFKYISTYVGLFALNYFVSSINPDFNILKIISDKRHEAINSALLFKAQSILFVDELPSAPLSYITKIPESFNNVIASPYPWLCDSPLQLLASIENILFILFCLTCILFRRKSFTPSPLFYFILSYTFLMILIIGFTTPVLGNIIRYKILLSPFLAVLFLMIMDMPKTIAFFAKLFHSNHGDSEASKVS